MKVLILGGVAAGTKVAAKLKRELPDADVCIVSKGKHISYAGCGLPYYVGNIIHDKSSLIVNTPEKFSALTGVTVKTETEAIALHPDRKTVEVKDLNTGKPHPIPTISW